MCISDLQKDVEMKFCPKLFAGWDHVSALFSAYPQCTPQAGGHPSGITSHFSTLLNRLQIQGVQVYNHAVSAKKFRIIEGFLALGWSVLLSDIDVVVLRVCSDVCCICETTQIIDTWNKHPKAHTPYPHRVRKSITVAWNEIKQMAWERWDDLAYQKCFTCSDVPAKFSCKTVPVLAESLQPPS